MSPAWSTNLLGRSGPRPHPLRPHLTGRPLCVPCEFPCSSTYSWFNLHAADVPPKDLRPHLRHRHGLLPERWRPRCDMTLTVEQRQDHMHMRCGAHPIDRDQAQIAERVLAVSLKALPCQASEKALHTGGSKSDAVSSRTAACQHARYARGQSSNVGESHATTGAEERSP